MNRNEDLAIVSKDLMWKDPYYGLFLIMLNKEWNNAAVPAAGVARHGLSYKLYLNEDYWDKLSFNHKRGLLKHECMHICMFHPTDYEKLTNKQIRNIAMDLEINQMIDPNDLPEGGMFLSTFPELKLPANKGTHFYYEELMKAYQNKTCPNLNAVVDSMTPKVILADGSSCNKPHHDWREFEDMDEATKKLIHTHAETLIKEVADQVIKSRGIIPSELKEILDKINNPEPPKFDWKGYLRRFTGGSTKIFTKKSRRKLSKRFEGNPGLKIKPKRHILVALDTSGSVSTEELKEFLGEIHHMEKTGTDITIIQADAAISYIGKFNPQQIFEVHGRGGTSFDPVIDYYNENTRKYTCLIYLTDGEAPAPAPAKGRMLWVLSSKSKENPDLIGPQIILN